MSTVSPLARGLPRRISVDNAGDVTVTWGPGLAVVAAIPDDEWATVDQTGWDFVMVGRTGGSGGDDIALEAQVACLTAAP